MKDPVGSTERKGPILVFILSQKETNSVSFNKNLKFCGDKI
jgi:hypothetical protein